MLSVVLNHGAKESNQEKTQQKTPSNPAKYFHQFIHATETIEEPLEVEYSYYYKNQSYLWKKPELVTNREIEWVKIQLKGKKEQLIGSFYMSHRSLKCVEELEKSLELATKTCKNILLSGDFNCPDIEWETISVHTNANERDVQLKLLEVTSSYNLTQMHEQPTRENNLLDIVLTTNPSLVKTSSNAPGISDHEMVVTDCETKPYYQHTKPRKCYIYSKANGRTSTQRSMQHHQNYKKCTKKTNPSKTCGTPSRTSSCVAWTNIYHQR